MKRYTLGIESSCDEAAIGVICDGEVIYKDLYSSSKIQALYGGVVPEIASRMHEENFSIMLNKLIKNFDVKKITDIAYTAYPGLIGGLHVAAIFAKTLAWQWNLDAIEIDHRHGHIFSASIGSNEIKYPFLALVVSGKTSSIYKVDSAKNITELLHTTDDAAGETLDKIGRKLGMKYPAGKTIDDLYSEELAKIKLIPHNAKNENFSFSGFKTSVINLINKNLKDKKYSNEEIASSSMKWIVDELIRKLEYCVNKYNIHNIFIGGGVSASKTLKNELEHQPWIHELHLTDLAYTGDNGVMIAYYAQKLLQETKNEFKK